MTVKRETAKTSLVDIYENALRKLRADKRSLNRLEEEIGIPAETLRDIKRRIVKNPRLNTLRALAKHYAEAA